jgi:hypothetical protein
VGIEASGVSLVRVPDKRMIVDESGNKSGINDREKLSYSEKYQSRDSSVGTALGYGLDDRGFRVRFLAGAGNFSLHHRVQNGSGAHPASYPMGTRGCF